MFVERSGWTKWSKRGQGIIVIWVSGDEGRLADALVKDKFSVPMQKSLLFGVLRCKPLDLSSSNKLLFAVYPHHPIMVLHVQAATSNIPLFLLI